MPMRGEQKRRPDLRSPAAFLRVRIKFLFQALGGGPADKVTAQHIITRIPAVLLTSCRHADSLSGQAIIGKDAQDIGLIGVHETAYRGRSRKFQLSILVVDIVHFQNGLV